MSRYDVHAQTECVPHIGRCIVSTTQAADVGICPARRSMILNSVHPCAVAHTAGHT